MQYLKRFVKNCVFASTFLVTDQRRESVKFPVQIVRGVILGKPAELSIPEKKNI